MHSFNASRRLFLRTASALGAAVPAAGAGFALNLATVGAAAAQSAGDYKALVCVFLYGGCDYANTVLATDTDSWNGYLAARSLPPDPIALDLPGSGNVARATLPIVPLSSQPGRAFALHPNLAPLKTLFDANRAAVVANVGPLIEPLTKAQYTGRSVPRPAALFSHNDQQSTWMAFGPEGARVGWGGRIGDLLASANADPVFTCISASGNAVFLSGEQVQQYQVSGGGAVGIQALNNLFGVGAGPAAFRGIVTESRDHLIERAMNRVTARSIDAGTVLNNARDVGASALGAVGTSVPANNGLANQLAIVARIIGGQSMTGARRQVFLVGMGGFDTHDGLNNGHGNLMRQLADAIAWFDGATDALGLRDRVTLFTASDFGRTLTSNGDGSDHGWGSHHFVVGGAVRGHDIYGRFPTIGVDTNDDVGQGRLLPGLSVDQYAATLGRWFGVSDTHLLDVMPNLKNFSQRDLGFMA
ncbi:MAG: DUF1501 domain-containing protein [Lautropia sp.]